MVNKDDYILRDTAFSGRKAKGHTDELKFRIDADLAATLRQWLQYYDSTEIRPRDGHSTTYTYESRPMPTVYLCARAAALRPK